MEKNTILNNLQIPGIEFDNLPKPGGSYVAVNIRGNIAYVAIQFPIKDGRFFFTGRFGESVTTEEGYEAARLAAMNVLGQINKFVGFDNIIGLNHADIYYRASEEWDDGPRVANGASTRLMTTRTASPMRSRASPTRSVPSNSRTIGRFTTG